MTKTNEQRDAPTSELDRSQRTESRRAFTALLGAFGAAALAGCRDSTGPEGDDVPAEEPGSLQQALTGTGVLRVADSAANLRVQTGGTTAWIAAVQGIASADDGSGGVFYWSDTAKRDNGWSILNDASGNVAGWRRASLSGLPEGWFSVKDARFGAVGDGERNDTAAIQSCIEYVAGLSSGGTVYLPPGRYLVSAETEELSTPYKLLLRSNVSIRGAGRNSVLVSDLGQNLAARTLASASGSILRNVTLADFAIDGRECENSGGMLSTSTGVLVCDGFSGPSGNHQRAGILIHDSEDITIRNIDIKDTADAIRMFGPSCERTVIEGCFIHDCVFDIGREVIQGEGLRNSKIINNTIWNCEFATGIKMENASGGTLYNNIVSGNILRGVGSGILMAGGVTVSDNVIEAKHGHAIWVGGDAIVTGNRIIAAVGAGIAVFSNLANPSNVRISKNQIRGVTTFGSEAPIAIEVSARYDGGNVYVPYNITVEDNDIQAFAGSLSGSALGIRFEQTGGIISVRGNRVADARWGLVAGASTARAIENLDISHNQFTLLTNGKGIMVGARTSIGNYVHNGTIAFNTCLPASGATGTEGIHIEGDPNRLTLIGNNTASCATPYAEFYPPGPTNKISANNQGF